MRKSGLYYGTLLLCILTFSQPALSQALARSNYNGFNIFCAGFANGRINMTLQVVLRQMLPEEYPFAYL